MGTQTRSREVSALKKTHILAIVAALLLTGCRKPEAIIHDAPGRMPQEGIEEIIGC
jgi:hypothetical protein